MWDIRGQVKTAASEFGHPIEELSSTDFALVWHGLWGKFTSFQRPSGHWIWENLLSPHVAVQDKDAWRWIEDYVGDHDAILLIPEFNLAFRSSSGSHIVDIVGELYAVEFGVTSPSLDYLLWFSHHDCLIAAGNSVSWLEGKVRQP